MSHLHLQDLLQPLHDDQCGPLDCRVTVLCAVLHYLHQRLVGCRAEVVLVTIGPADTTIGFRNFESFNAQSQLSTDTKTKGFRGRWDTITSQLMFQTAAAHYIFQTQQTCLPVCGLQKLMDNDLKGRGQTVGAGFIHVLGSIGSLVCRFSQRREGLEGQRPGMGGCETPTA